MKKHALLALFLLPTALVAQAPAAPKPDTAKPKFVAADVQVAPHRDQPFGTPGAVFGDRYIANQTTMLGLVAAAYGVQADDVGGGPSWLELNHYNVIAKVALNPSKIQQQQMLQSLLEERFHLVVKNDTKEMPAYILSVGKASKLKEAESTDKPANCKIDPINGDPSKDILIFISAHCTNMTVTEFAEWFHNSAGGYFDQPLVDRTEIKGVYDIDIKWSPKGFLARQGADGISVFDALEKQLGLKAELKTAPRPVLNVVSVDEKPTPNAANIAQVLPPAPPARFEVATIRPSAPDEKPGGNGFQGDRIDFHSIPVKFVIAFAWNINPGDDNAMSLPKWTDEAKITLSAKVDHASLPAGTNPQVPINIEDFRDMLQALLIDRYHMKVHTEDRPGEGYALLAVNPKLTKADPTSRTRCKNGPGPDGKDPRKNNPILDRLITCQNMTMEQISDELQRVAGGYIKNKVTDKTGLKGGWDFTLSFSSIGNNGMPQGGAPAGAQEGSSEPTGALSLFDAVSRQLGLKLEKEKRNVPVLVIDHMEEKPVDN